MGKYLSFPGERCPDIMGVLGSSGLVSNNDKHVLCLAREDGLSARSVVQGVFAAFECVDLYLTGLCTRPL